MTYKQNGFSKIGLANLLKCILNPFCKLRNTFSTIEIMVYVSSEVCFPYLGLLIAR